MTLLAKAKQTLEPVVILVDDKKRDLNGCALIAKHLSDFGIETKLEPLEAFRAAVPAHRPGMIIFNHLTASHLSAWSQRLADIGVLSAVLPNEGIMYDADEMRFMAGRYHNNAHIDFYFCWNEPHRKALIEEGLNPETIKVVGVPRFDFYFRPWSRVYELKDRPKSERPRVLVCTNFQTAKFFELPRIEADRAFANWAKTIPLLRDYWGGVQAHWRARSRFLDYLNALVDADKFEVVLRPHPREQLELYEQWLVKLSAEKRKHVDFQPSVNISSLILDCDLEISCETCTTAIESWIARKPTVELIFERNPLWYRQEHALASVDCEDPSKLAEIVSAQLRESMQPAKVEIRRKHLEKWCSTLDGASSLKLATIVAEAIKNKKPADWSKLTLDDYRRGWKLKLYAMFDQAYHFDPFLKLKRLLLGATYELRRQTYDKSIKPSDVRNARGTLEAAISNVASAKPDRAL